MKVGALLPTFQPSAAPAFAAAHTAAELGLNGVFAYDHLWPMGRPDRPALAPFPVLAAVARQHPGLTVGPLVARVTLVGPEVLIAQLAALAEVAGHGTIAALGTGDHLSQAEDDAYGITPLTPTERRTRVAHVARGAHHATEVWIGGGARATEQLCRELGATLNLWQKSAADVRAAAADGPVSWAGPAEDDLMGQLDALAAAGATWAVLDPRADLAVIGSWRRRNVDAQ